MCRFHSAWVSYPRLQQKCLIQFRTETLELEVYRLHSAAWVSYPGQALVELSYTF